MDSSGDSAQEDYGGHEELNGDERAERELFENPYQQRERRPLNGRDDATYGIFAEDEEDGPRYARAGPKNRAKYVRAQRLEQVLISLLRRTPTFVSKGAEKPAAIPREGEQDAMDENEDGESPEEDSSSDSDGDLGDIPVFGSRRKRDSAEEDEEEEPPARGTRCIQKRARNG